MATTQLALYNIALFAVGERAAASTSEDKEAVRLLNEIWARGGGATRYFLEQGTWDFGSRAVSITENGSPPAFGFTYAFDIPSDYVRLVNISLDAAFGDPLYHYHRESGYFYADSTPLYLRYVSDNASYGGDLTLWPDTFVLWCGHWLATQIAPRIKNDIDLMKLEARTDELLISARLKDAAQAQEPFPAEPFDKINHRHKDHILELLKARPGPNKEAR